MEEIALEQIMIRLAAMPIDQLRQIEDQVKQELKKRPVRPVRPGRFTSFITVNGLKVPAELFKEPDPEFKKMLRGDPNA